MTLQGLLGILAGLLSLPALGFYVWGILRHETKPNRVTWWVFAFISIAVILSYRGVGAWDTLWLPITYALSYVCIGVLSIKYGDGQFSLSWLDRAALIGGIASVIAYCLVSSPLLALFLAMLSEFIAMIPTAIKSYTNPETEDRTAWIIGTLASFVNVLAIGEWSLGIAAYPVWAVASNALIVYLLIRKRVLVRPEIVT